MVQCDPEAHWCQCESFQPLSKELYAALCVLTHRDRKDKIFHSSKWPGHRQCYLTQDFRGDDFGCLQAEFGLRISIEIWFFFWWNRK